MFRSRWWPTSAPLAAGLAFALAGAAHPAWSATVSNAHASASPKAGATVSLKVQDAPLSLAVMLLTQQAEVVVANNKELANKTVTVNLKDRPIEEALDKLLTPNNIPWYRADDGTYIINATRPAPASDAGAPSLRPVSVLPAAPDSPAPARFLVTEKIELYHISPDQALVALGLPPSGLDQRSVPPLPDPYQIGRYANPTFDPSLLGGTLQPANPTNPVAAPTAAAGSNPAVPLDSGSGSNDGLNRTPTDRDQFGQFPGPGGRRPGFQPRSGVPAGVPPGTPGSTTGTNGQPTTGGARGFVPAGIELVAGLGTDNSLLVQGPPDDIDELRSVVRLLDITPQQVSIKVDVITVSTTVARQFGAQWEFFTKEGNIRAQSGGAGNVPDGLTVDIVRGNIQAIIGSLTTNGHGRVIASPIVTTQNNTPANIQEGTSVPVFLPVFSQGVGGTLTQTQVYPVTATTGLNVIPRVNRDGTISVTGIVNVQNIVRIVSSPDGSTVAPETSFTSLGPFVRRVASGETLVIGGLSMKSDNDQTTRYPLLSDIPLIGRLFRTSSRNDQDQQLLIFLTPRLVSEHAGGADTLP